MIKRKIILLTYKEFADELVSYLQKSLQNIDILVVETLVELESIETDLTTKDTLLSYSSGTIVPARVIRSVAGRAYNFHAASPDYPGRDPHHFAIYDEVKEYGATSHLMVEEVDAGQIIGVEKFDVPDNATPSDLLEMANQGIWTLFKKQACKMVESDFLLSPVGDKWGGKKTSRKDFVKLCSIPIDVDELEFSRRLRACHSYKYNNLSIELFGYSFVLDLNLINSDSTNESE